MRHRKNNNTNSEYFREENEKLLVLFLKKETLHVPLQRNTGRKGEKEEFYDLREKGLKKKKKKEDNC